MDNNNISIILVCIIIIYLVGIVLKFPIMKIIRLIINSILGGVLIFFINQIGIAWNIHIGLNVVTSALIGLLGIPGAILLLVIKFF